MRVAIALAMVLVLLAGVGLVGCGNGEEPGPLKALKIEAYQYLKGQTADMSKSVLETMATGGGEPGWKTGMASTIYPTFYYTQAAKDTFADARFPDYWFIPTAADVGQPTKFSWLTAGDQGTVDQLILANMPAKNQDVVETVVAGFFNTYETELADAKAANETSAYGILVDSAGQAAADAWVTAIGAVGADYADEFFYYMINGAVQAYGCQLVCGVPAGYVCTTQDIIDCAKAKFTNGTAATMYPTKADETAQAMYGEDYADCDPQTEQPVVAAAVYAALPSCFASDAARTAVRDAIAAYLFSSMGITTYAGCTGLMRNGVDQMISGIIDDPATQAAFGLSFGPHQERDYVDFYAVPGAIAGWGKEMADPVALDETTAYVVLENSVAYSSAEGFKSDVEAGMHPRQAFYKWLAWAGVYSAKGMGTMIQLCLGEFSVKVDNLWTEDISIDNMTINIQVESDGFGLYPTRMIDVAKLALGDRVWVEEEGIILKLIAGIKTMDIIVWLVMAGLDSTTAGTYAADCWSKISPWDGSAGTATFHMTLEATMSTHNVKDPETITETYELTFAQS